MDKVRLLKAFGLFEKLEELGEMKWLEKNIDNIIEAANKKLISFMENSYYYDDKKLSFKDRVDLLDQLSWYPNELKYILEVKKQHKFTNDELLKYLAEN